MTRTGRMSEERLEQGYPALVAQWRQAGLLSGMKSDAQAERSS